MKKALLLLSLCLLLTACGSDEPDELAAPVRRTVLVYMIATNSLGNNHRDLQDLDEMDQAVTAGGLNGCRWLVYRVGPDDDSPTLFEIKKNKHGTAVHEVLEVYPATQGASVTAQRMSEVIDDARRHAPAQDYGLVLWSHATGWAPSLTTRSSAPRRVFGEDNGATMPLHVLAGAIPQGVFSWIYADVCYMGAVEVAYQLRDRCRYFVGYPTEIPARGMPYDLTLPLLCASQAQLVEACRATFEHYNALSGSERTFTGAVVDCRQLDALAALCRRIHADDAAQPSLSGMQCYNLNAYHFLYDFVQYTQACATTEQAEELSDIYNKVVLYKAATRTVFDRILISTERFSGLSTYVPGTSPGVNEDYYRTLDWAKAIASPGQ
ncbi:MAG: hypothetical protein IJ775_05880 [Muribaculaceae bacterium]|nr:hypothetical protein [Muribaculaceae bacterium]